MAEQTKPEFSAHLSAIGNRLALIGRISVSAPWRPVYWLYAATIPASLFAFEALKISSYAASRAPNVSMIPQLIFMLLFYGVWILVPRLCWWMAAREAPREPSNWRDVLLRVGALGFLLSLVHLLLLAFLLRIMYSPPGWGVLHLLHSLGEVWLGNAGMWLMIYSVVAAVILYMLSGQPRRDPPPARFEVRENGKTLSIPITDIYWIKAAGNYVELHTKRGVTMVRMTLSEMDKEIGAGGFVKSHRGALVNGSHVLAIRPKAGSSGFVIQLSNDEEAPLSRRRLAAFKQILKSIY